MRTLVFVLLFILVLASPQFSQTQLLKVGNAVEFGDLFSAALEVTVDQVTINGKVYLKRKLSYQPWNGQNYFFGYSYDRIEGDSVHYKLTSNNADSLSFNFNWPVGTVTTSFISVTEIFEKRIDNIYISSSLIPQDTIYIINWYTINLTTGDTMSYGDPFYDMYSKKLGLMHSGLGASLQGAKIDGVRYGSIGIFPEEIVFSEDSIYIPTLGDTGSVKIVNTSDYPVRIDSIISVGSFYGYRGFFRKPGFEYQFYLFQTLPSPQWSDTLGIIIPPHDSINVSFYEVDLCPVCDYEVQDYFKDTLRFVFTFMDGNVYSFSNSISISGEGHPSDLDEDEILPNEFVLHQNYPNPFNPSTSIQYAISSRQFVSLKIYDVLGNEISTLVNEYRDAGNYEAEFNASKLSSGVYYYQLKTGDFIQTKKMIYLK